MSLHSHTADLTWAFAHAKHLLWPLSYTPSPKAYTLHDKEEFGIESISALLIKEKRGIWATKAGCGGAKLEFHQKDLGCRLQLRQES